MTRAEAVLADEYEESKAEVQRTVAAKLGHNGLAGTDLDAAYNEAWHALYLRLAAEESIDNRKGFLVTVTYRRALSERRASRPMYLTRATQLEELGVEPDIDARLDAELQLRNFVQGLRTQLGEREMQAATLIYLHGLSRPEAAKVIGIAPRRMEKLMDRASNRINAVIDAVRPGELCDELDSPVRALAVGLLDEDGKRYAIARDHLESCPACRRKVLVLRGLGAISPPLPGLMAVLGGATGVGTVGVGVGQGALGKVTAVKVGAGKLTLAKLGAKAAGLSQKAVLIGGTVTATTAVAVVGTVAVVGGGRGTAAPGAAASAPALSADGAGAGDGYFAMPTVPRKPAKRVAHRHPKRAKVRHHRHRRQDRVTATASEVSTVPEEAVESPPEAVTETVPETTQESAPAPSESAPSESTAQPESPRPTTNAAVEFELR